MNLGLNKDSSGWITLDPGGDVCERCSYWIPNRYDGLPTSPTVLLGAGAAVDAGLPGSVDLATQVAQDVMKLPPDGLNAEARELISHLLRDFRKHGIKLDIEMLMTAVHLIGESAPTLIGLRALLQRKYQNCRRDGAGRLGFIIWDQVCERLKAPSPEMVMYLTKLLSVRFNQDRPLEVFTLNYDLCFETALKEVKACYATGLDKVSYVGEVYIDKWNPQTLNARELDVRLFKLHGSLDWVLVSEAGSLPPIILGFQEKISLVEPFWSQWNQFVSNLAHTEICVIIGYGFRDEHVNVLLEEAATRGVDLVIVQPDFYVVNRWASRLEEGTKHLTPLFFTAKEALLGEHVWHALASLKVYRSLEKKGHQVRETEDMYEYLKEIYILQHGRHPGQ